MANKEKLLALADVLETRTQHEFDMSSVATCLLPYINRLCGVNTAIDYMGSGECADYLGMTEHERMALFFPGGYWVDGRDERELITSIEREDAVAVVRNFAETSEVDWKLRFPTMLPDKL